MWWHSYETIKCGLGRNKGRRRGQTLNCIEKVYCRILNEKKTTIVKVRELEQTYTLCAAPQRADSGNPAAYRQGKAEFYWKSPGEGEHVVSGVWWGTGELLIM
jgi:hypothetical protein